MERALVTGAGTRLGRAMALKLAAVSHGVAVHYNSSRDGAEAVVAEIRAAGGTAVTVQADLMDEVRTAALVDEAAKALGGPLTCLVNNASTFIHDNIETATRDSWDTNVTSNLRAPFILTQQFARQVPEPERDDQGELRARAAIVNMLDQRVRKLTPEYMSYTIAKMGLWAFTQTAARALSPKVRVNAIGPGSTLPGGAQTEEQFRRQRAAKPLGRGPNVEDITAALAYLIAAPAVTGQLICVDGGQHIAWQTPDILSLK